jgi:two-component system nitrogen regulation sensor histidine kinase GlnL
MRSSALTRAARALRLQVPMPTLPAPIPDSVAVLGALPIAAVVLDAEDRFRFANPAAELFFQHSAASLRSFSLHDLLPGDNRLFRHPRPDPPA